MQRPKKEPLPAAQPVAEKPKAQLATAEQIDYIVSHTDDQTYENAMNAFGAELERMTYKQAEALIKRIDNMRRMNEEAMMNAETV